MTNFQVLYLLMYGSLFVIGGIAICGLLYKGIRNAIKRSDCKLCGYFAECLGEAYRAGKCDLNLFQCPECLSYYPKRAWQMLWDWSGPRCPKCLHGDISILSKFVGKVESGRSRLNG